MLTAHGRELHRAGRPLQHFSETINAVVALRPTLKRHLHMAWSLVKTHLEECTTRYLGFKCFLFSVYRVYPEVEDGRGTLDLACAFAVLFGVGKPGSVLLTAEVVW